MEIGRLKAVIFDVDGTLIDSNHLHVEAWQVAFRKFGKELNAAEVHEQIGKGGDQLMPVFLNKDEMDKFGAELEEHRTQLFKEKYLARVTPFPRVRELFEKLKEHGFKIVLASSATEAEVESHTKTLEIADLIDATISADDAERSKPAPDIFQSALDKLGGITAGEAIVVGDSPWDVKAAEKAGMHTICVLSGGFTKHQLTEAGAVEIYESVGDLIDKFHNSCISQSEGAALLRRRAS